MPNNRDDDLSRRLAHVEQTFGLVPRNNTNVATNNDTPIQAQHTDAINWKALYKVHFHYPLPFTLYHVVVR